MSTAGGGAMRRFEDRRWSTYEQEPVWRHEAARRLVRSEPVLDVGGGDGLLLRMLADRGFGELAMADFSSVAVERARAAGFVAHLVDLEAGLPFDDDAFGTVCALDVLEHLLEPERALAELARVGREVVIVVPNFSYWRDRVRMLAGRVPFQLQPGRGHVYWFNRRVLDEVIASAGLGAVEVVPAAPARLGLIGRLLAARFPNAFAHSFAVRASRPHDVSGAR
jgi:methionine biosynthesis protein MetW